MRALTAGIAVAAVGLSLAVASPAGAELSTTTDPAGDGMKGRLLDVTSITVDNRDHAVVVTVSVERLGAGDIGVRFRTRSHDRDELAGVVSERVRGRHRDFLATVEGRQSCPGLRVRWDYDADLAPKGSRGRWRWTSLTPRG